MESTPTAESSSRLAVFWRLMKPYLWPRRWVLIGVALLGSMSALAQNIPILLIKPLWPVISNEAPDADPDMLNAAFFRFRDFIGGALGLSEGSDRDVAMLWAVAITVCLVGIMAAVAQYFFVLLSRWIAYRTVVDLRMRIAEHLMGLSVRYHGRRQFGDLLSRVSADVQTTLYSLDVLVRDMVMEPTKAMVGIGVAIYAAPKLTIILLIALPVLALPAGILSRKVRKGSTKSLTSLGASVQAMSQMFQGVRTVKAFRAEERELDRYRELNDDFLKKSMKMVRAIALTRASTALLSNLGLGAMLLVVGILVLRVGDVQSGGNIAMFFLGVSQSYNHLRRTTQGITRLQESMGAAVRLQDLLDERVDLVEADNPLRLNGLGEGIRLQGVSFVYGAEDGAALSDIDLDIRPGETIAFVGPSGSGKSTLMDIVARFIDPTGGSVTVDGKPLRDVALDDWAAQYAMVGQVPFLFHATIGENIRYGKPGASQAEVEAVAKAAHIHEFIASLPDGYETDVADGGSRLSGGQRQRIAIARALLKGAPLLLLDEATSALDAESERDVQQALDELVQGRTVIVIAHRLSTIRQADRIAVLDEGRLVELGTHAELLERDGVYARLHALSTAT